MAKAPPEMTVITKAYDLVIWSCHHIARFPRSHRFTLGERLEVRLYEVLEKLIRAKFSRDRLAVLQDINLELILDFGVRRLDAALDLWDYGGPAKRLVRSLRG